MSKESKDQKFKTLDKEQQVKIFEDDDEFEDAREAQSPKKSSPTKPSSPSNSSPLKEISTSDCITTDKGIYER